MRRPPSDGSRVVLVTGGASGLGATICETLGREGSSVAIADPAAPRAREEAAGAVAFALTRAEDTVIPEIMVLPMRETSWPRTATVITGPPADIAEAPT